MLCAGLCGVAAVFGVQLIIVGLGFTAAGIAANSTASWIMSLYNGTVTTASLLQTVGAAGMATVATVIGASAAITRWICSTVFGLIIFIPIVIVRGAVRIAEWMGYTGICSCAIADVEAITEWIFGAVFDLMISVPSAILRSVAGVAEWMGSAIFA